MTESQNLSQNFVPLSRVVNAAATDMYENAGKVTQKYSHWACRGLFQVNMQILKGGKRSVLLHVNSNTHTATLPADFNGEVFVGVINKDGYKIPLRLNTRLTDTKNIEDIPCEDACPKCNTSKSICNELTTTVSTSIVVINAANYEQSVIKKLYPNGDYYLESSIPFLDINTNTVSYRTSKELVAHIDLKPCGCIEDTQSNIDVIRSCNQEVYCSYFAPCGSENKDFGSYSVFEENGLIQLSPDFKFDKIYLEYRVSMLKINGQFQVPKIAFETLVEWTKYKAIQNKRNVSRLEKNDQWNHYLIEKSNLRILKSRGSLANLIQALKSTPKFDYYVDNYYSDCRNDVEVIPSIPTDICSIDTPTYVGGGNSGGGSVVSGYVPFSFGVIVGVPNAPVDGSSAWQNDALKGALNLNSFILQDTNYTLVSGDFTFDTATGTIDISPNKFFGGDALTGIYFKKI
ncbi:MAG: hypothetical protein ABI091_25960 [Ferruginibacter sp.]